MRRRGFGKPNKVAQRLLDDASTRWCNICQVRVYAEKFEEHQQSYNHRMAVKNARRMEGLATSLWEKHRGAPVDEDSPRQREVHEQLWEFLSDSEVEAKKELVKNVRRNDNLLKKKTHYD